MTEPDTRFALVSPFLGEHFDHTLTSEDFGELRKSFLFLKDYMRFEETVLQCLYSFEDFEEFILKSALQHYLFPMREYDFLQDTRVRSNIKVLSLLNSVTSLRDQFPKFRSHQELSRLHEMFRSYWDYERDSSAAFAFFERLRNFAQHQTQPVSGYTTGSRWDDKREISEARAAIFVTVDEVCSNRAIGQTERERYTNTFGEKADLSLIFRETIGRIGEIATKIRKETDAVFKSSEALYQNAIEIGSRYQEKFTVCDAVAITGDSEEKQFSVFGDFLERARRLRRTFLMKNNQSHIVSNRAMGHKSSR
jgi:hypothetical protein